MKRKALRAVLFALVVFFSITTDSFASAHSGGTDDEGGHNSPDGYHYHHGYPAHQHSNGECPYDFDDNVDHSERSGGGSAISNPVLNDSPHWYWIALIIIAIFFLSFALPSIIAVRLGLDEKRVGCLSWIIFIVLLVLLSYLLSINTI